MQVQFLEDEKTGLLLFHAENIDGVIELDNSKSSLVDRQYSCRHMNTVGVYSPSNSYSADLKPAFAYKDEVHP